MNIHDHRYLAAGHIFFENGAPWTGAPRSIFLGSAKKAMPAALPALMSFAEGSNFLRPSIDTYIHAWSCRRACRFLDDGVTFLGGVTHAGGRHGIKKNATCHARARKHFVSFESFFLSDLKKKSSPETSVDFTFLLRMLRNEKFP